MFEDIFDGLYDGDKFSDVIRLIVYGIVEKIQYQRKVKRFAACQPLLHIMGVTRKWTSNSNP